MGDFCEFWLRWSADPDDRIMCGGEATKHIDVIQPQRNNRQASERVNLCVRHFRHAGKVLVAG